MRGGYVTCDMVCSWYHPLYDHQIWQVWRWKTRTWVGVLAHISTHLTPLPLALPLPLPSPSFSFIRAPKNRHRDVSNIAHFHCWQITRTYLITSSARSNPSLGQVDSLPEATEHEPEDAPPGSYSAFPGELRHSEADLSIFLSDLPVAEMRAGGLQVAEHVEYRAWRLARLSIAPRSDRLGRSCNDHE